ncbi:hypothetical protein [Streptomyces sp. NRRL S-340]|uniref:hypothetical protein n=1 Tax=Streptomyces sp. NRRL S-340 TaxID=1463901 RepID=UPI001F2FB012|nr:hypothetical protein [Streptomyces sp. NRRL S-340]
MAEAFIRRTAEARCPAAGRRPDTKRRLAQLRIGPRYLGGRQSKNVRAPVLGRPANTSEHSNEAFAWHAAEAYVILNARGLGHPPKPAVALVRDAVSGALGVARIARQLRDGTVA